LCRPGGNYTLLRDFAVVSRGFSEYDVCRTERYMDHLEHGHRRIIDPGSSEKRYQIVSVSARADSHFIGKYGSCSRNQTPYGGISRGNRSTVFSSSTALTTTTRSRNIGHRAPTTQICNSLV